MAVGFKLDPRRGCAKGNGSCPPEEGACVSGSSSCSAVLGLQARRQDRPPQNLRQHSGRYTVFEGHSDTFRLEHSDCLSYWSVSIS